MRSLHLPNQRPPNYLLASGEPGLGIRVGPVLMEAGAMVEIAISADAVLEAMRRADPPDLVLLDSNWPGGEAKRLLSALHAQSDELPIIVVVETLTAEWLEHLREGVFDDLILRDWEPAYWELRAQMVLRTRALERELENLRNALTRNAQVDRLTGVLNRDSLLAGLFRETDRVQRSNGALAVILFDIDDFGHWNLRLGENACDEILCETATRTARLLRSYDLLGRSGKDEFLIGLPGCSTANALMLAERLRSEVFAEPYRVDGEAVRLSACFGLAQSLGRSPIVVLREAEQALALARETGPESIQCGGLDGAIPPPVTFFSATSGEELLAW